MKRLYVVTLVHEIVVVAEDDRSALAVAKKAIREYPGDCGEPRVTSVTAVMSPAEIPRGWGLPFGGVDGDNRDAWQYLPRKEKP